MGRQPNPGPLSVALKDFLQPSSPPSYVTPLKYKSDSLPGKSFSPFPSTVFSFRSPDVGEDRRPLCLCDVCGAPPRPRGALGSEKREQACLCLQGKRSPLCPATSGLLQNHVPRTTRRSWTGCQCCVRHRKPRPVP